MTCPCLHYQRVLDLEELLAITRAERDAARAELDRLYHHRLPLFSQHAWEQHLTEKSWQCRVCLLSAQWPHTVILPCQVEADGRGRPRLRLPVLAGKS